MSSGTPQNFLNGVVAEVILFTRVLSVSERQRVEGYLADKWGLNASIPAVVGIRALPIVSRSFHPLDVPGCALWLDAEDASSYTTSGTTLTAVRDKSGNAANITTLYGTTPSVDANGINGLPVFNMTNARMSGAFASALSNYTHTIFMVTKLNVSTFDGFPAFSLGTGASGSDVNLRVLDYAFSQFRGVFFGGGNAIVNTVPFQTTSAFLWTSSYDGGPSSSSYSIQSNAGSPVSSTVTRPLTSPTHYFVATNGSSGAGAFNSWPGLMGEIIVFNRVVSSSECQQIECYLAAKWRLIPSLPATHPFKTLSPSVPVFSPTQIPGCLLWFNAADASSVTGTNPVTAWVNRGSLATTATVLSGTTTYTTDEGGRPLLRMPTGATLGFNAVLNTQARSWFAVVRNTAQIPSGNILRIVDSTSIGQGGPTVYYVSPTTGRLSEGPLGIREAITATVPNPLNVIEMYSLVNSTTAALNVMTRNGTSLTLTSSETARQYDVTTNFTYKMPRSTVGCDYYEVLFYAGDVTANQRQQVEGYLAHKWGLVGNLPATHPYKKLRT
jgi:hypothetical protein